MRLVLHRDVFKERQALPRDVFRVALEVIVSLPQEPRPPGAIKLAGSVQDYRIGIGQYRIVYEVDERSDAVTVFRVAKRSDAYER